MPADTISDTSFEGRMENTIETKVLYNWLYQQEEENYYLDFKISDVLTDSLGQEAFFVEY